MPAVRVLSSLALKGVLETFRSALEHKLGALDLRFDATQALLPLVRAGEPADLVILTAEALDQLAREGLVRRISPLGSSGVGIAVRAGAPRPDIGSLDALKHALVSAHSVAHSKVGASGLYFAELIERLGIASQLKKRIVVDQGPVGRVVASGEAELGVQQLCELAPVPGIDILGPLPDPVQKLTWFAAGIPASGAHPEHGLRLIEFLRSSRARAAMLEGGLQPERSV